MVEGVFIFMILVAVIVVAAVLFVAWVMASIARLLGRTLFPPRTLPVHRVGQPQRCENVHCRTENPPQARFCRRCGHSLPMLMKILPATAAA